MSDARCFGQDLMRGEYIVGGGGMDAPAKVRLAPGGGGAWLGGPRTESSDKFARPGLTWVGGDRDVDDLDEVSRKILAASSSGTSIFDPVVCELAYRWFSPPTGVVLDPFAGGSVRGIVAERLGRKYTGFELRAEQVAANREQAARICVAPPVWIVGDSAAAIPAWDGEADFVFSCPPYGNLEVYSDDPSDLSAMPFAGFVDAYRTIIAASVAKLRPDRFACFVVGNYRDKRGFYCDLVGETVRAFQDAGAGFYNEAVLVTAVGSLPIRVGKQFTAARKLGKTHQNVLVFCKGDPKRATQACAA